jgi:hypothetical protein
LWNNQSIKQASKQVKILTQSYQEEQDAFMNKKKKQNDQAFLYLIQSLHQTIAVLQ